MSTTPASAHRPRPSLTDARGSISAEMVAVWVLVAAVIAAVWAIGIAPRIGETGEAAVDCLFSGDEDCDLPGGQDGGGADGGGTDGGDAITTPVAGGGDFERPPRDPYDPSVPTAPADDPADDPASDPDDPAGEPDDPAGTPDDPAGGPDDPAGDPDDEVPTAPPGAREHADEEVVDAALAELEDLLDGEVNRGDLEDIDELLGDLGNAELNAVVGGLSNEQLQAWAEGLQRRRGWWPPWRNDTIDDDRQRELLNALLPGLDPRNVARMVAAVDQLSPAFDDLPGSPESEDGEDELRYARLDGAELYVGGVDPLDIHQGAIGDCHLMATLGALAAADPDFIDDMITDNGNGTYTVRLYDDDGRVEYVTVDDRFPVDADTGNAEFARPGRPPELWPLIVEKAYAQRYGSYGEIEGAPTDRTVRRITGEQTDTVNASETDVTELAERLADGEPLAVRSLRPGDSEDVTEYQDEFVDASGNEIRQLVAAHAYFVTSVDEDAGTVTLRNPHGPHTDDIVLTVDQMSRLFNGVVFLD